MDFHDIGHTCELVAIVCACVCVYRPLTNYLNPGQPAPFTKRVFIGEYGFKCGDGGFYTHMQAAQRGANVARAMVQWGAPFVLYWQVRHGV